MPARREPTASGAWIGAGIAVLGLAVVVLFFPMHRASWNVWAGVFVAPAVIFASLPAFARQAKRETAPRLYTFLVVALIVKLAFSVLRWHHAFNVVDKADAQAYDRVGGEIALRFLQGDFTTGLGNLLDTNFIRLFTGVLYTVIRPSALGGFLVYAWLAFWGTYFFYRAFVLAIPEGNRRSYAKWLFFMPTLLFWPSSIGKESWLMFGLGLAAFGTAKVLTGRFVPGIVVHAIGVGLVALVRAPIGVLSGVALVAAGFLGRKPREGRRRSFVGRIVMGAIYVGIGLLLYAAMQRYLVRSGFETGTIEEAFAESSRVTSTGGSEFTPAPINTPLGFVWNCVTVLFRPFFYEAGSLEARVTSIEATLLLIFSIVRFRSFIAAARNMRRIPYVLAAAVYVLGSIVALSPVANFGIIARQRSLIYPMYLVFLCMPVVRARRRRTPAARPVERTLEPVGGRR